MVQSISETRNANDFVLYVLFIRSGIKLKILKDTM